MSEGSRDSGWRHWLAFFVTGSTAFVVDWGMLKILTLKLGVAVLPARIASISVAMIVAWLGHRTFTFAVRKAPSLFEFVRYVGAAWSSAAVNWLVFAAILFVRPTLLPDVAMFASTVVATIFSYLALRFGVFRSSTERV